MGVAGTADLEGTTAAGSTGTATITQAITVITAVGAGLPVDTTRGGCFRCQCLILTMDIMAPGMGMGMDMDRRTVMGTDTDRRPSRTVA
jgi:hypothetical protein